jgi:signal transduction histidine kinase/ActR/RegA family two-component response regulator
MPAAILALGLVAAVLWIGTDVLRERLSIQQIARIQAANELRVAVAVSHLWLEEYVTGDPEVQLANVWDSLDEAQDLARAMVEGGEAGRSGVVLRPFKDPELRRQAESIRRQVTELRESAMERQRGRIRGEDTGIGSAQDAHFDLIFDELSAEAKALTLAVERQRAHDAHQARLLFRGLLLAWCAIVSVAATSLWRRETRRRRVEEALRKSEIQLAQAQKLEAVGRLAGGLAHDINNYVTAITSQCELVKMKAAPEDRVSDKMDMVIATAGKVTTLVRQLLAFSRQQPVAPQVVVLNEIVEGLQGMAHRLIGEDIQLETFLADDLWPVRVDPSQVEQIVVNLLVNSREASPLGGKVTLETANVTLDREYLRKNPTVQAGDYVLLAVSDSGVGIEPDIRDKIFDPFFTTKEGSDARGLGLATIYGIVRQNSGHVTVYSEVGQGTTFKVYLPRSLDEAFKRAPAAGRRKSPSVLPSGASETVLLIEDNDELRGSIHDILETLGYRVAVASNGTEALAALDREKGRVDLVVSDVVMPGMSGQEIVQKIREKVPNLPVLFISGYTDNVVLRHGILEGRFEFLEKPFSADRLAAKIREVLPKEPRTAGSARR